MNWISTKKLPNISSMEIANLLEMVIMFYCKRDIWSIEDPDEYNNLCIELSLNKQFNNLDKNTYETFNVSSKLYNIFLFSEKSEENNLNKTHTLDEQKKVINVNDKLLENSQELNKVMSFFEKKELANIFYKLFLYAKQNKKKLYLDIRSTIIGVKSDGECLRFYSDKIGNIKFFGIRKSINLCEQKMNNLYREVDEVNNIFEKHGDIITNQNDSESKGYIYHSLFGYGRIIETDLKTIKVIFDDNLDEKVIQIGHHAYRNISAEDYLNRNNLIKVDNGLKIENDTLFDSNSTFKKVPWDKYETALLIEAFWEIEKKEGNRVEILTNLSKKLRQKAINQGQTIDDKFRNFNGMTMQMANLSTFFFPNRTTMHKTSIFGEIADLYNNHRNDFNQLLAEAHRLVGEYYIDDEDNNSYYKINFNKKLDLSFTQPLNVTYCGILKSGFDSWSDCYKYILQCLNKDFSNIISSLATDSNYSLISTDSNNLRRSIKISEGLYAEGNQNASDLMRHIRRILDKCGVNYESIKIEYIIKENNSTHNVKSSKPFSVKIKETDFYIYLKEEYEKKYKNDGNNQKASAFAQQCISYIREVNTLLSVDVFEMTTKEEVNNLISLLSNLNQDESQKKSLVYVIQKYSQFLISKTEINSEAHTNLAQEKEDVSDYYAVIQSLFPEGYAFANPLRKRKFIREYSKIVGKEFSDADLVYDRKISQIGFISEGKVYLPSIVTCEIKEEIQTFIDSSLVESPAIFYSAIYQTFREKLNSAFSEDMLKNYIMFEFGDMYSFSDMFVSIKGKYVDLKQTVIDIFLDYGRPLNMEELYNKLPNISHDAIDAIIKDNDFVVNAKGKSYFYKEIFVIDDAELNDIKAFIAIKIQEKETVTGGQLYSFITDKLPSLVESNPEVTDLGFKNVLKLKLGDDFNFKGDIISAIGQDLDVRTLYKKFCKQRENFTLAELEEFRDSIDQNYICWDAVLFQSIRVNVKTFVRRDFINFDVQKIDEAIGSYCKTDYISFNDIINFTEFPSIGYAWNNYVLESYLFINSKKFKLLHASFNGDKPVGGIVKVNSNINSFDDLLIKVIKNGKLFDRENVFNFLLENEFIRTRKIKNIELLIEKAKKEG